MYRLLSFLFGVPEEINGANRCDTYLYGWLVFSRLHNFKVYLHHFVGDDWSRDLHDHPKRFISIGLWGRYFEQAPSGNRWWRAPWIRTFPATHVHRLVSPCRCWTLVIVLKTVREWGFWHWFSEPDERDPHLTGWQLIHWRDYLGGWASDIADKMRDC